MLRKDVRTGSSAAAGTADPVEIARFDALADEWWKPDGAFKVVHAFNRVRVRHISERLPALLEFSDEAAQSNRDNVARDSEMMSPGVPG